MRLFPRLSLAFATVGLVSVLIFALFVVAKVRAVADAAAVAELEQEAELRANRLGFWVADQATFLEGSVRPYSERLPYMEPELRTGLLNAVYVGMPSAAVVTLVDGDGVSVASPAFSEDVLNRQLAEGKRVEMLVSRAPIEAARPDMGAPALAAIGAPYLPGGESSLSVPVATLATPQGPDELFLVAEIRLAQILEGWVASTTEDHAIALIGGTGDVLFGVDHTLVDERQLGALAQLADAFGNFRLTEQGAIGALRSVPGTDWTLVVIRPSNVALAAGNAVWRQAMAFLVFCAALSVLIGWLLSYSLTEPVLKLRDMVLSVADGQFGLRSEIDTADEIGELARAFNHMSARLAVNQKEIEEQHQQIVGFNEELQDRVERRTSQLLDAQDQLVRSGQLAAVAEVGAGLAHELNNPLAAILGTAQILKAKSADEAQKQLLQALEDEAQRCREVVSAMVRFSSGEEVDPDKAPVVDLRDVISDVTNLVQGAFRQRGVTLQLEMSEHPLPVRLDPVHGSRILAQILNGLRAGLTTGTTLEVNAREDQGEIVVEMRPDYPVAVDEFRRDDWMASGMGLWVARRLLDQLGGRLEQPVKVPWVSAMKPPQTEEYDGDEDPSQPLLADATWRVVLPRA